MVPRNGFEPSTVRVWTVCSSQLSYLGIMVEISGIEPLTYAVQVRRSPKLSYIPIWCVWVDLNHRPHAYQACALTSWATNALLISPYKNITNRIEKDLFSLERRWSIRTFPYGYLVTTSPQSLITPSEHPSLRLGLLLQVQPTLVVWRAVCTRPENVFTATLLIRDY